MKLSVPCHENAARSTGVALETIGDSRELAQSPARSVQRQWRAAAAYLRRRYCVGAYSTRAPFADVRSVFAEREEKMFVQ